jgi:TetR/AcrR family transcriptional repressor of nem operon
MREYSVVRPIEYDRAEVLWKAMEAFWSAGYEATSIADLATATGLSRSSIYSEFGSKRGLFDESLSVYESNLRPMLFPLEQDEPGLAGLLGFFDNWSSRASDPQVESSMGCLIVNSTTEMASSDEGIRAVSLRYQERLAGLFEAALERAEQRGEIRAGRNDQRARALVAGVMGVFVASHSIQDPAKLGTWIMSLRSLVESWSID